MLIELSGGSEDGGEDFFLPSSCSRARNVAPCGDIGPGSFLSGVRQSQLGRALFTFISFYYQPKTTLQEETPGLAAQHFSAGVSMGTGPGYPGDRGLEIAWSCRG